MRLGPSATTTKLEDALRRQVDALPAAGRRVLLVLAVGHGLTVSELVRVGRRLRVAEGDLDPVVSAGLIAVADGHVRMRQPLLRSVVLRAASSADRAITHRALADETPDPARGAWHRAAAAQGRDETVAAALEETAHRLVERGARAEAGTALRRAAALSPRPEDRVRRLAEAAEALRQGGMAVEATRVLVEALPLAAAPDVVRELLTTEWVVTYTSGAVPGRDADSMVARALQLVAEHPDHREDCLRVLLAIASRAWASEWPDPLRRRVREALRTLAQQGPHPLLDLAGALLSPSTGGPGVHDRLLPAVRSVLSGWPSAAPAAAYAAAALHDLPLALATWSGIAAAGQGTGSPSAECLALLERGSLEMLAGRIADGLASAELSMRVAVDLRLPLAAGMAAVVVARGHALRGSAGAASAALQRGEELSGPSPLALVTAGAAWAAGLLALVEHRYRDAVVALEGTQVHSTVECWAVADFVEAAVLAGDPGAVTGALARSELAARTSGSHHLWTLVHRCRALLSDGPEAAEHLARSLVAGSASGMPLELARTRLAHGRWLCRNGRPTRARDELSAALHALDAAGAHVWADQAAAELTALGAVPRRTGSGSAADVSRQLTAQDLHIARLAASGKTNAEIADLLYLSHRAVAARLSDVARRLGLADATRLPAALLRR